METISSLYADFLLRTRFVDLGDEVVEQAKKLILDLIGVSLAGYRCGAFPRMAMDYFVALGGKQEASVIQGKMKIPAIHAAFANSVCAHALDMDDGHRFAASHPGTVIIPSAIAAAEYSGADTKKLIAGVVAGYDVMIRIGKAIASSCLNRGFHLTGITGSFGAATAAANILELDRKECIAALGLAGIQSAGLLQVNHEEEGSMAKPINPARAAMSGLLACFLAKKGAKAPLQIFEGEDGYLKAFAGEDQKNLLVAELGRPYEISTVYLKFYAACRHAHAPIEAALEAVKRSSMDPSKIRSVSVETYPAALRLAGIQEATTPSAGRFSIPFSVAVALIRGTAGAQDFSEETVGNDDIRMMARKVDLCVSEKWAARYPAQRGATVRIVDDEGHEGVGEVELAKGEPETGATWEELIKKFSENANLLLPKEETDHLRDVIINLERYPLEALTKPICHAGLD